MRIEGGLDVALNAQQRGLRGVEHGRAGVAAAKARGMATGLPGGFMNDGRRRGADKPAQAAEPFHQLRAGKIERGCGGGQRQSPQRGLRIARPGGGEPGQGLLAQPGPESGGFRLGHALAAQTGLRGLHGRLRAAQPQGEHAFAGARAAVGQPGAGVERQGLRGPGVAAGDGFVLRHGEAQGGIRRGHGHDFERHVENDPERAERAAQQPRHIEPGDVFHHLAAEAQHLALAAEQRGAEHIVAHPAGADARRAAQGAGHHAAQRGAAGAGEVRRLEGQELVMLGQRRLNLGQRRARPRGDDQLGRLEMGDARQLRGVERVFGGIHPAVLRGGPPRRLAAAAVNANAFAARGGFSHQVLPKRNQIVCLHVRDAAARGRSQDRNATRLKPGKVGKRQQAAAHMHLAVLGAAGVGGNLLAGVERFARIEGAAEGEKLLALFRAELHAHGVDLLEAHAVLASDRAAHGHAGLQNLGAKFFGAVQLAGLVGIEQDERVQIAVARMEHVHAAQPVLGLHALNGFEHVGHALARNGAVHAVIVGRDAAGGGKGVFAPAPEAQTLGLAFAAFQLGCAATRQHFGHAADFFFDLFWRAVALAQQYGLGFQVVARVHEGLCGHRHGLIHHFQPGRNDARGDDGRHRITRLAQVVEAGHDAARQNGFGQQLHRHFGDDHEHAFAADHGGQQIGARTVAGQPAEGQRLALHRVTAHLQHVVHGEAVFEAMHAARVFGDVAADGAGDLAARVGRVEQAVRRCGLRNRQVAHPAFHRGGARDGVDALDAVEPRQRQQHPVFIG